MGQIRIPTETKSYKAERFPRKWFVNRAFGLPPSCCSSFPTEKRGKEMKRSKYRHWMKPRNTLWAHQDFYKENCLLGVSTIKTISSTCEKLLKYSLKSWENRIASRKISMPLIFTLNTIHRNSKPYHPDQTRICLPIQTDNLFWSVSTSIQSINYYSMGTIYMCVFFFPQFSTSTISASSRKPRDAYRKDVDKLFQNCPSIALIRSNNNLPY